MVGRHARGRAAGDERMICPRCNHDRPDPPICVARANGFDPDTDCRTLAAQAILRGLPEKWVEAT